MISKFLTIRKFRPDDMNEYVRLHVETAAHDRTVRYFSEQALAEDLGHPRFHPERDLFIAERDKHLIGYASAFLEPGIRRALLSGLVHPHHRKKGIATALLDRIIRYARNAGSEVAHICIPESNVVAKKLILRFSLAFIRRFVRMKLDLSTSRLTGAAASGYTTRHLRRGQEHELTEIQNRSFADSWGFNPNTPQEIAYRINVSNCSPEDVIMTYHRDKPIGYCWTRRFLQGNPAAGKVHGEIHMLGVDPDFRRQGVGRSVLLAGLAHLKNRGVETVELTTDSNDQAAWALYESVGFNEWICLEWYEKKLS